MTDKRSGALATLWTDNQWVLPILGLAGVVATFLAAGWMWGLALVGLVVVMGFIAMGSSLRKAFAAVEQVTRQDDVEVEMDSDSVGSVTSDELRESDDLTKGRDTADDESSTPHGPTGDLQPQSLALAASRNSEENKVVEILEPWIEEGEDDRERFVRRGFMLRLLIEAGRRGSLQELLDHLDERPSEAEPIADLGRAMVFLGELRAAAEMISERLTAVTSQIEQVNLRLQAAQYWRDAGEPQQAIDLSCDVIALPDLQESHQAAALEQLGLARYDAHVYECAFSSMEQALSIDPTNSSLRFQLAWRYAEQSWHALAAEHYRILADAPTPAETATNNLGAALMQLGLIGVATSSYERATKQGSARAAGNLAHRALDAGLVDYAKQAIAKGREVDPSDERIESAAIRLGEMRAVETPRYESVRSNSRDARQHLRQLVDGHDSFPEDRWFFSPGGLIVFDENEHGIVEGRGTDNQEVVTVLQADEFSPMRMRWIGGELEGYEGPVSVQGDRISGVAVERESGMIKAFQGFRQA